MSQAQKPQLNRKSKKLAKYASMAIQKDKMEYYLKGEGLYLYQNNTNGSLMLPKPVFIDGIEIRTIAPGKQWEGDNYYMDLVNTNMARLIREIISPEQERNQKMLNEEKLILDQPETVTNKGVTEQVVVSTPIGIQTKTTLPKKKLAEQKTQEAEAPVLLTEDPLAGVQILG